MYFLAVIGGGPAGYTAAERALEQGRSVVLFEQKAIGGTCLNEGCIPTKTLLYSAKTYASACEASRYGVSAVDVTFDYGKISQRKGKVVRKLQAGIRSRLNSAGCVFVQGTAVVSAYAPGCITVSCNGETYESENLLLCTGSVNWCPSLPGLASEHVWSSSDALASTELPASVVIVGGGVVGMEFAVLYSELGLHVDVVELLPEVLGNMDSELVAQLRADLSKRGISFHLGARLKAVSGHDVFYEQGGEDKSLSGDKILVCMGRRPNLSAVGCLDLQMEKSGVRVDAAMRTSLPNVYAAGDITGFSMLAHTAVREAEVAVSQMLGGKDEMRYDAVPGVVYSNPELAGVGETEKSLHEKGIAFRLYKLPLAFSGRFVAENEAVNGLCKIVAHSETGRILGVHLLGNGASEIINTAALAIEQRLTVSQWKQSVFAHPTVGEILKEALCQAGIDFPAVR